MNNFNEEIHEIINGGFQAKSNVFEVNEISYFDFRSRFTSEEKVQIELSTDAKVRVLEKDINARALAGELIRLKSEQLIAGIEYYRAQGLLDNDERVQQILAPVIND